MGPSLPEFRGLDEMKTIRIYRRDLPHWRQDGATYFVTFRLRDSIPVHKVREWRAERQAWYRAHGLTPDLSVDEWQARYKAIAEVDRQQFERRIAHQLLVELDKCHGSCVLREESHVEVIGEALRHFDGTRCRCGDYAVLPNHTLCGAPHRTCYAHLPIM